MFLLIWQPYTLRTAYVTQQQMLSPGVAVGRSVVGRVELVGIVFIVIYFRL